MQTQCRPDERTAGKAREVAVTTGTYDAYLFWAAELGRSELYRVRNIVLRVGYTPAPRGGESVLHRRVSSGGRGGPVVEPGRIAYG